MTTIMTRDIHEFTKEDWYGFSGAERFEDGGAPLMCEMKVGENTAFCIAHGMGINVDVFSPEDTDMSHPIVYSFKSNSKNTILNKYHETMEKLKATGDPSQLGFNITQL